MSTVCAMYLYVIALLTTGWVFGGTPHDGLSDPLETLMWIAAGSAVWMCPVALVPWNRAWKPRIVVACVLTVVVTAGVFASLSA
ncbi:hypothetical protein [Demequina sp. NBRC 110055]|uniref:hypothetical protein n=1 Tax=Demequina sp. NBRC 110055 TaxID=1570344 RepID=UPI00118721F3|nr:hypothetical protein [Demequina sp. NBRC 110055]